LANDFSWHLKFLVANLHYCQSRYLRLCIHIMRCNASSLHNTHWFYLSNDFWTPNFFKHLINTHYFYIFLFLSHLIIYHIYSFSIFYLTRCQLSFLVSKNHLSFKLDQHFCEREKVIIYFKTEINENRFIKTPENYITYIRTIPIKS